MADEIHFCPNCGSLNVEPDTSNRAEIYFSGGNPNKWMCNECKYNGLMPEGDPEEDFGDEMDQAEFDTDQEYVRIDTGFGEGYLKFVIYIIIPATFIYLVLLYI
ncbi:MAG: hypothetical protein ABEJ56_03870 [Candidatus Nanohaloarchaea archaeon]